MTDPAFSSVAYPQRHFVGRRDEYFGAMGAPLESDGRPVTLRLYERDGTLRAEFLRFCVQTVTLVDAESGEQLATDEGEKLFVSERESPPSMTLGGFLIDSDVGSEHAAAAWDDFYEIARASQCVRHGRRLTLESYRSVFSVLLTSAGTTHGAGSPHRYDLSCSLLVVETLPGATVGVMPGTDVVGRLTAEGAVRAGLLTAQAAAGGRAPEIFGRETLRGRLPPPDENAA